MRNYLFAASALISSGSLLASPHPAPGQFGVVAEYLYLMPSVDDTYFVIDSPATSTFPSGDRENNDFGYHSGFRVGGVMAFCDCDRELQVYYSHLNAHENKTVTGDFLWATQGRADFASNFENYAGTAASKVDIHYNNVDFFLAQRFFNCCDSTLAFKFGLEYAKFKFEEDYTYTVTGGIIGDAEYEAHTWGIGPKVGFDYEYDFWRMCGCMEGNFSLNFGSAVSLLSASTHYDAFNSTTTAGVETELLNVDDKKTWGVVPAFHANVGIAYNTCLCGMLTSLEVGYEYHVYVNGLPKVAYPDDVADALTTQTRNNFGLQGLYVSASVAF